MSTTGSTSPAAAASRPSRDLTTREKLVAAPLIAAFVVLGFLPNIALNVINPAVDKTLSYVQQAIPNLNPAGTVAEGSSK